MCSVNHMKVFTYLLGVVFLVCSFSPLDGREIVVREILNEENDMESQAVLLVEDFTRSDGISSLGTEWRKFTDKVMGGVSTGSYGFETINGRQCIRMRGNVSLENRGGFVQVALPLKQNGRALDGSGYNGIRLWVRGNGETYYVHLRTGKTIFPWQYYEAPFFADREWEKVEISFDQFTPQRLKAKLTPKRLKRIGIVAAKKAFKADVAVARIEFYR